MLSPASPRIVANRVIPALALAVALALALVPRAASADEAYAPGGGAPESGPLANVLGGPSAQKWGECDLTFENGTLHVGAGMGASCGTSDSAPAEWIDAAGGADNIEKVVFDGAVKTPDASLSGLFGKLQSLESIEGLGNLRTAGVKNMSNMCRNCSRLTPLDLSKLDTGSVEYMNGMFANCINLTSLDLSKFDTKNVKYMNGMFVGSTILASIVLSPSFDTKKVEDMSEMFSGCIGLTSLDLSSFDTKSVEDMSNMFRQCELLTSLDLSKFDTGSVVNMNSMFYGCSRLTSLDLSSFDTKSVEDMSNMFRNCSRLTSLDLSKFNTKDVESMSSMFEDCSSLASLDLSSFEVAHDVDVNLMLGRVYGLRWLATPASDADGKVLGQIPSIFAGKYAWYDVTDPDDPQPFGGTAAAAHTYAADAPVDVAYVASPAGWGGSVDPAAEPEGFSAVTGVPQGSTAAAEPGWRLVGWYDADGNKVSSDARFVPQKVKGAYRSATYTAEFEEYVTITYEAEKGGSATPPSEDVVRGDVAVGSTAEADPGFRFVGWFDAKGNQVSTDPHLDPPTVDGVYSQAVYTARFKELEHVTLSYMAGDHGSVSPQGESLNPESDVAQGSTAAADPGWRLEGWYDESGSKVSSDARFVPARPADGLYRAASYTARFAPTPAAASGGLASTGDSALPAALALAALASAGALAAALRRRRG